MKRLLAAMTFAILASTAAPAEATYWFKVNDASQIQYQIGPPDRIFLRNLSQFDGTVLGCCYNYWIDLSTAAGKAQWATLLAKMQAKESIWIFVMSQTQVGTIDSIGEID